MKFPFWTLAILAATPLHAATPISKSCKVGDFPLGCQAYSFRQFTCFEAIDKTKAVGGKTIELFAWQKLSPEFSQLDANASMPDDKVEALRKKLNSAGIRATSAYVANTPFTAKDPEQALRKVFAWAKKLDLIALVGEPPESSFDLVEKLCKEYDIQFNLHNHRQDPKHPEYKNWDPEYTVKLMKHRDPHMGFCLDAGHLVRSGKDPIAAIRLMGTRLHELHLKDPEGPDGPDIVFGGGIGNTLGVLKELKAQHFKGFISIEYENPEPDVMPDIQQCIRFVHDAGKKHAAAAVKPNLIFILADDMGYGDIGPFGSRKNRTPNLDRMAKEGMKLTSFYAAPLCTPSRAQILTGCYAKRVSLPDVLFPRASIGLSAEEHTIATMLHSLGYATMAIGKWHVGDDTNFLPTRRGFDHYLGLPYSNDMGGEVPGKDEKKPQKRKNHWPPLPLVRDEEVIETLKPADQDKLTALYTEEAIKFITGSKDRPFFLYLPHTAVHVPLHPGENFKGKSANGPYGDWVEEVDWCVGRVMDAVRDLGLSERTLILFSSDNGPWIAQGTNAGVAGPLRGGKGGTYEGGVREPTLAWWPGKVPAGAVCDAMAANYDLLPTFVSLAGGTLLPDHKIDGMDISELLLGRAAKSPHPAHFYFASTSLQAVRSGPWKLALVPQYEGHGPYSDAGPDLSKPLTPRLYNLDEDIGEKNDVAAAHPEVVKRLLTYIREMDADLGASKKNGPGVRPPGHVPHPAGLWLPGQKPVAAE